MTIHITPMGASGSSTSYGMRSLSAGARIGLRQFLASARGSWLGLGWTLLTPIIYVSAFVLVRRAMSQRGLELPSSGIDPIVYATIGVLVFQSWMEALLFQLNSFTQYRVVLKNMGVNLFVLFTSNVTRSLLSTLIRIPIALMACFILGAGLTISSILAVPALLITLASAHAIGFLLSPLSALFKDIRLILQAFSIFLLVASGAFFALDAMGSAVLVAGSLYPAAVGVDAVRSLLLDLDPTFRPIIWAAWTAGTCITAGIAFLFANLARTIIAERM